MKPQNEDNPEQNLATDKSPTPPIVDAQELERLVHELAKKEVIAFDTEFIRERTYYPEIALIQVGTEHKTWLIDPLALSKTEMKPLLDLFQDKRILKILHAAQGDQECLFMSYGVTASPTFDTAQGAALLGFGDNVGLAKILKETLNVTIQKGHARTDWTARPLQKELLRYAHGDVAYLVNAGNKLLADLEKKNRREWALELSARWEKHESFIYDAPAQALKHARGGRLDPRSCATLAELLAWRDARAAKINIPRRRLIDDEVLIDLSRVRPQTMDHLTTFRGLNKGELKISGEKLLEIFTRMKDAAVEGLPTLKKSATPTAREAKCLDVLACFLKILAEKHDIVPRHLINSDELLPLVRGTFKVSQDLVTAGLLTEGAAKLIGDDLVQILNGKMSLSLAQVDGQTQALLATQ